MKFIKQITTLLLLLLFVVSVSFTVFADDEYFANGIIYSKLPEPVPTDSVAYLVLTNSSNGNAYLYMFTSFHDTSVSDVQFLVNRTSSSSFTVSITSSAGSSVTLDWNIGVFSAKTGAFLSWYTVSSPSFNFTNRPVYDSFVSYGCVCSGFQDLKQSAINWGGYTDKQFQEYLVDQSLPYIEESLRNLVDYTDDLEGYLDQVEGYLYDIRSYSGRIQDWLLNDLDEYLYWLKTTFSSSLWARLNEIHQDLLRIEELLGSEYESTDIEQPTEQQSAINELASAEEALGIQDSLGSGVDSAFDSDSYGAVFGGNGAFALIKTGFETLILDNTKINALIIFALTLGIGILIIGRRVQA